MSVNAIIMYEFTVNLKNSLLFQKTTKKNGARGMKKRTILIVTITLFLLMLPMMAGAEIVDSGTCEGNLTWTLDDEGLLTISGTGSMWNSPWRNGHTNDIKQVIIKNGVTCIGQEAFNGCINLTRVSISKSVTQIESFAFSGCTSLTKVTIPNNVSRIFSSAFSNCTSLSNIAIPDSVTEIGGGAFSGCSSLNSIIIPNGITNIESGLFRDCTNLTSITIPGSVTSISEQAFYGCSSLINITIPDGVNIIGINAFRGCSGLSSITLPDSVTSIGMQAFSDCTALKSIAIPDNVTHISNYTFYNCKSMSSVTLPDGLVEIGEHAFGDCSKLKKIVIPESVKSIGNAAFSFSGIESITLSDSITCIEKNTFFNCSQLSSIEIPDSVVKIGTQAFINCYKLNSITIPESVLEIGEDAFKYCYALTSVTIPSSVLSVGNGAFSEISGLKKAAILGRETQMGNVMFQNSDVQIYCYKDSAVENWADIQGYTIVNIDNNIFTDNDFNVELPADFDLACGHSRNLQAQIFPYGDSSQIVWSVSDTSIVTIDQGIVTAHNPGSAIVSASIGANTSTINITTYIPADDFTIPDELWCLVKHSQEIPVLSYSPLNATLHITWGGYTMTGTNRTYACSSACDQIVSAITSEGLMRTCTVHFCYPVTAISFEHEELNLVVGNDYQLSANVIMSDQSCVNHLVTFSSSNESIAIVNAETGFVRTLAAGDVTITATSESNRNASILIHVIEPCIEHTINIDPAVSPTCTEYGLTEGMHCARCGEILAAQEIVNKLDHNWGECVYTWNTDLTKVIGTRICRNDETHVETETVNVIDEVTRPATCEDEGETTYTSMEFENEAFTLQSKVLNNVEPLGHDLEHHEASVATCTEIGWEAYDNCKREGCDYTTYCEIPALGHSPVIDSAVAPTQTQTGLTEGSHCSVCGEELVAQEVIPVDPESSVVDRGTCGDNLCWTLYESGVLDIYGYGDMTEYYEPANVPWYTYRYTIKSLVINDGVTSICGNAFNNCRILSSVSIPDSIKHIGYFAFSDCSMISEIYISSLESWLSIDYSDCTSHPNYYSPCRLIYNNTELTSISIPENMNTIGDYAFANCNNLTDVTISNSVVSIGEAAFSHCGNIVSIHIPASVSTIGIGAFNYCYKLEDISISNSISIINDDTFRECSSLSNFALPENLVWIGGYAFYGCSNLFNPVIPEGVKSIGEHAFQDCNSITYLQFPDNMERIEQSAFYGCNNLNNIFIPNSVISIGHNAFGANTTIISSWDSYAREWAMNNNHHWTHDQHTLREYTKVDATCTETGTEAYWKCEVCGDLFSDAEAKNKIDAPIVIAAKGHTLNAHAKVDATCTETGTEAYWKCEVCGDLFSDAECKNQIDAPIIIAAIGHSWASPSYLWAEDNSSITATRICIHNEEHVETESVPVTSVVTKQPSCTEKGETTYTSVEFENEAFTGAF